MKDSGIEWIGEVSNDVNFVPLKYLLSNKGLSAIKVGPFGSQLSGSDILNEESDYWVYDQRTVLDKNFTKGNTFISEEKYKQMKSFQVEAGDILITTRGTIGRICRIPKNHAKGILHPCVIRFRLDDDKYRYDLLELIFNCSNIINRQLLYKNNATTIDVIYSNTLKNLYIPVWSLEKQKSIALFLNSQCTKIDSLIAIIQSEIDTLEQYKRSVITEAVTKGLDPNVKMKYSGIEWIGCIPAHWSVPKITYILNYQHPYPLGDGDHGSIKASDYTDSGIPFIRVQNLGFTTALDLKNVVYITEEQNRTIENSTLHPGDILFAKTGATIGKVGIVPSNVVKANTTSHVGKVTVSDNIDPKFIYYVLSSQVGYKQLWDVASQKSTRPELSIDEIKNIRVLLPDTKKEQEDIARNLDSKCIKIDNIISLKRQQLSVLDSYKKSLIFEYVTGKKEVPSA